MPLDQETIVLMQAVLTDEAKSKRLAEIVAASDALDAQAKDIAAAARSADAMLADAQWHRKAGDAAMKAADARKAGLDEREAEIAKVGAAMDDEKKRFEEVRTAVAKQHTEGAAQLAAVQTAQQKRNDELIAWGNSLAEIVTRHAVWHGQLAAAHAKIKAAIPDLPDEIPDCPAPPTLTLLLPAHAPLDQPAAAPVPADPAAA